MLMQQLIPTVGAVITTVMGLAGLIFPLKVSLAIGLKPVSLLGRSEIRATYGGLFLALGLTCLWFQSDQVFAITGVAWLGAAIGRLCSILIDRSISRRNFIGFAIEFGIGAALFFPHVLIS